jgi:hypothetical protein
MSRMSRMICPLAVLGALLLTMPVDSAAQCEREGMAAARFVYIMQSERSPERYDRGLTSNVRGSRHLR